MRSIWFDAEGSRHTFLPRVRDELSQMQVLELRRGMRKIGSLEITPFSGSSGDGFNFNVIPCLGWSEVHDLVDKSVEMDGSTSIQTSRSVPQLCSRTVSGPSRICDLGLQASRFGDGLHPDTVLGDGWNMVKCWSMFDPFYIIDLYGFVQKQAKIQWYSNGSHVSFQNDDSITWGILYIHFLEKPLFATDWTRVVCQIRRGCDATRGPKSARGGTFVLSGRGKQSEGMKQRFPSCPHHILWFGWWFPGTTSICLFQSYQASCASGSHRIDN